MFALISLVSKLTTPACLLPTNEGTVVTPMAIYASETDAAETGGVFLGNSGTR